LNNSMGLCAQTNKTTNNRVQCSWVVGGRSQGGMSKAHTS
jgi:hypothetical protein